MNLRTRFKHVSKRLQRAGRARVVGLAILAAIAVLGSTGAADPKCGAGNSSSSSAKTNQGGGKIDLTDGVPYPKSGPCSGEEYQNNARRARCLDAIKTGVYRGGSRAGSGGSVSTGGIPANAAHVCQHFLDAGWSHAQAAGIVGNFWAESEINQYDPNPAAKGGWGGIAQWEGGRWNRRSPPGLLQFAASQHTSWDNLDLQMAFVDLELRTTHAGAASALRQQSSPEGAASSFMRNYESPNPIYAHEDRRRANARKLYSSHVC